MSVARRTPPRALPSAPMPEEATPVTETVRRRLRALRIEQGLTLEAVASRAAIDVSTLSRLESGKRRLALDHLPPLAAALGTSVDDLLRPAEPLDPRVRGGVRRCAGLEMRALSRHHAGMGLQAFKMTIDRERIDPPTELPVHPGHEWLYVLHGRLRLLLGEQDLVIEPGEAVEFSTLEPHWFGAVDGPVEAIAIFGPDGERVHLRDGVAVDQAA